MPATSQLERTDNGTNIDGRKNESRLHSVNAQAKTVAEGSLKVTDRSNANSIVFWLDSRRLIAAAFGGALWTPSVFFLQILSRQLWARAEAALASQSRKEKNTFRFLFKYVFK